MLVIQRECSYACSCAFSYACSYACSCVCSCVPYSILIHLDRVVRWIAGSLESLSVILFVNTRLNVLVAEFQHARSLSSCLNVYLTAAEAYVNIGSL